MCSFASASVCVCVCVGTGDCVCLLCDWCSCHLLLLGSTMTHSSLSLSFLLFCLPLSPYKHKCWLKLKLAGSTSLNLFFICYYVSCDWVTMVSQKSAGCFVLSRKLLKFTVPIKCYHPPWTWTNVLLFYCFESQWIHEAFFFVTHHKINVQIGTEIKTEESSVWVHSFS